MYHDEKISATEYRFDIATGKRQLVATLNPNDPTGSTSVVSVCMTTPDRKTYAYSYAARNLSDLNLVDELR